MVDFRLQHVIHIWKAMTLSYNLAYQETILVHLTRRHILLAKQTLLFTTSETFSYLSEGYQRIFVWN